MNAEIIAIECSRRRPDLWNVWTLERIKSAFSLGHGTLADFRRFVRDNSHYAHFITAPSEIEKFLTKYNKEATA